MHAVYLSTNGDTTTFLPEVLEVHGYGCGVIDLDGYITIPESLKTLTTHDEDIHDTIDRENIYIPTIEEEEEEESPLPLPEPKPKPVDEVKPIPPPPTTDDTEKKFSQNLYLCCDIIKESTVGNIKLPVLRYIKLKKGRIIGDIYNVIWLNVIRPSISSIRLYIADDTGKIISFKGNTLNCMLLFIPH